MTQRNDWKSPPLSADAFAAPAPANAATASPNMQPSAPRTRRAARVSVSLPIELRDQFGRREDTRTHFVTLRGAVVETSSDLRVGHKITVRNLKSGRSAECHIIAVESPAKQLHEVEFEFTAPQPEFWPVQFPSEDLKSKPPASAHYPSIENHGTAASNALEVTTLGDSLESTKTDDGLVVHSGSHTPGPSASAHISQTNYVPPAVGMDTVAQFRAANRAAHRREQNKRTFYSILTILVLAGSLYGGRVWLLHKGEDVQAAEPKSVPARPSVKSLANRLATTQRQNSETLTALASAAPTISVPQAKAILDRQPVASPGLSGAQDRAEEETAVAPVETQPEETQVAVNHSAPLASRQTVEDPGDQPLALPLHVSEGPTTGTQPQLLSSVVGQAPQKAAVLAAQVPKRLIPAKLVYSVPAQYPAMARQIHVEGEVIIRLNVDVNGTVSDAKAVTGVPLLRAAALDAVRKWKYQPATLGDKPVATTETVKVDFHLK